MKPKNTEEFRAELAEQFAHVLEEKGLEWRQGWRVSTPKNGVTGKAYRGLNVLRLKMKADEMGYRDDRWVTFNQVRDKERYHPGQDWHLRKGAKETVVEYWFPYDRVAQKAVSWDDYRVALAAGRPEADFRLKSWYVGVFNGDEVEGMPVLAEEQTPPIQPDALVKKLSERMGVPIEHGGDRAYYMPQLDRIRLPEPGRFKSEYEYDATALHELAHSTGHKSRLNRLTGAAFGTEAYAYEELVAEMSACFMTAALPLQPTPEHLESHKAYVQSWIEAVRNKPDTLVRAIRDAQGAANYMDYQAELITEAEYQRLRGNVVTVDATPTVTAAVTPSVTEAIPAPEPAQQLTPAQQTAQTIPEDFTGVKKQYVVHLQYPGMDKPGSWISGAMTAEEIEASLDLFRANGAKIIDYAPMDYVRKAERNPADYIPPEKVALSKRQDTLDILRRAGEPIEYKKRAWRSVEHDSLVITEGKGWYWHSRQIGSQSPIDYFMTVHDMTFQDAVRRVLDVMGVEVTLPAAVEHKPQEPEFCLPKRANNHRRAFAYLTQSRHIDPELVTDLLHKGLIYQTALNGNVCFVGYDYDGKAVSAFKRSTLTVGPQDGWKRGDETGSQKAYRFRLEVPESRVVNVFEAEIDLLSYLSLYPQHRAENCISLGGVSDRALAAFLEHREVEQINVCTDNDDAGNRAAKAIADKYGERYTVTREISETKDWNEDLCLIEVERERLLEAQTAEITRSIDQAVDMDL